jgi:hypothetical protein
MLCTVLDSFAFCSVKKQWGSLFFLSVLIWLNLGGHIFSKVGNCFFFCLKNSCRPGGVAQVIECLPRKPKALSSNTSNVKNKNKVVILLLILWDSRTCFYSLKVAKNSVGYWVL